MMTTFFLLLKSNLTHLYIYMINVSQCNRPIYFLFYFELCDFLVLTLVQLRLNWARELNVLRYIINNVSIVRTMLYSLKVKWVTVCWCMQLLFVLRHWNNHKELNWGDVVLIIIIYSLRVLWFGSNFRHDS